MIQKNAPHLPTLGRPSARALLGLVAICGALWGCSDSPTEPDEILTFAGTVEFEASSFHEISSDRVQILRITPTSFVQTLANGTVSDPSPLLPGVRLGTVIAALCVPTSTSTFLAPGQSVSFRLNPGDYCVQLFDAGVFPEGSHIDYVLVVDVEKY